MKELYNEPWSFTLFEESDGALLLEVVCGTTAIFTVKYKLTTEEKVKYQKEGIPFIQKLASDIQYSPSKFQK